MKVSQFEIFKEDWPPNKNLDFFRVRDLESKAPEICLSKAKKVTVISSSNTSTELLYTTPI
jgi:hypothetical protein